MDFLNSAIPLVSKLSNDHGIFMVFSMSRRTRSLVPICHVWRRLSQLLDREPLGPKRAEISIGHRGVWGITGFQGIDLGIIILFGWLGTSTYLGMGNHMLSPITWCFGCFGTSIYLGIIRIQWGESLWTINIGWCWLMVWNLFGKHRKTLRWIGGNVY